MQRAGQTWGGAFTALSLGPLPPQDLVHSTPMNSFVSLKPMDSKAELDLDLSCSYWISRLNTVCTRHVHINSGDLHQAQILQVQAWEGGPCLCVRRGPELQRRMET